MSLQHSHFLHQQPILVLFLPCSPFSFRDHRMHVVQLALQLVRLMLKLANDAVTLLQLEGMRIKLFPERGILDPSSGKSLGDLPWR